MIGWIHLCVQQMILDKYGADLWQKILSDSGIEANKVYHAKKVYEDKEIYRTIRSISINSDIPVEKIWEMFGEHMVDYAFQNGFDKLLVSMADNIQDFIDNLNAMHFFILKLYLNTDVRGPAFQSERLDDGTIRLHYFSNREGIYPMVMGLLRQAARKLFDIEIKIMMTEKSEVHLKSGISEHVVYKIETPPIDSSTSKATPATAIDRNRPTVPLSIKTFSHMFPTHICFNRDLVIEHCGSLLCNEFNMSSGQPLLDLVQFVQPKDVQINFETISSHQNNLFICQITQHMNRCELKPFKKPLFLKGQMFLINDGQHILYLNSLHVMTARQCLQLNIYMTDLQKHDVTRDVIMLNQARKYQKGSIGKLEESVNSMKLLMDELEELRSRTDSLMYDRIPRDIAYYVKNGIPVEAEVFPSATCLITEICNFDVISVECKPTEIITIMTDLFQRYNRLVDKLQCYKVLSIMDSYFVIAGAPQQSHNHAEQIMNLALCMLVETKQVVVPNLNLPLMIRAGVHTGPIVAGVMGTSHIRYGVLGETVNMTKRLATSATRGTILVSDTAKEHALYTHDNGFVFETRGYVYTTTWKRATCAHYLIQNSKRSIWEIMDCQKPLESSIDGYREAHNEQDKKAWEEAENRIKKLREVVSAFRGERMQLSRVGRKLRTLKHAWASHESHDSGISRGTPVESAACCIC
ncbi:hypothetical protein QR680_015996 [Steinernema hermaphroditum]|uniref:guanylate cyclase n=1 Tax=Steinernema hermaphroditum TaxID=289476 RepID=A0AA39H9P0_9BILA|nr:hypothetical protein QR680_015996 [Steinernema hermaphroditum]